MQIQIQIQIQTCMNRLQMVMLLIGGIFTTYRSDKVWYYSDSKPSHTWGGAHNFYKHWKKRAGIAKKSGSLGKGDVVNIDFQNDGKIDYTVIITKVKSGKQYYTQHTTDSKNKNTISDLYKKGYTLYGYDMDKASN